MLKRIILVVVFLLISHCQMFSQSNIPAPFYISLNAGGFITAHENFSKTYDSNLGFTFGGGIGLPLSSKLYMTGRGSYFSKSGVPILYHYKFDQNGRVTSVTQTKEGTAKYTQWFINGGLEYKIPLSESFTLYPMAGVTYSKYTEEAKSSDGSLGSSINASGVIGLYGGAGLERRLEALPLTVFAETYYNFIRQSLLGITGNIGGASLNLGVRYYLRSKRNQ
ncbi:MAG: autotransporter domain-containing protein [Syntrophomonadaceae bacterium]